MLTLSYLNDNHTPKGIFFYYIKVNSYPPIFIKKASGVFSEGPSKKSLTRYLHPPPKER
ncbi:hypothetical protein JN11_03895 [Mucilaginibacter frigoritolerans]|uniref:Uncharacterized protein n=1 Tax=Mucilaginibacter frigoritolerans TaxID=652788 RepID=A0A562TTI2_9SPHI|nr:hypothetical protein JN11_03895 [Mucilaginibacter frigoritolerans]